MSLKTAWLNLQDGLGNRFAWSHVNAIYYSQAQNKLLKDKLDDMETAINAKVAKTDIVQVESTSQSTVPSSAYLKTVKDALDSDISELNSGCPVFTSLGTGTALIDKIKQYSTATLLSITSWTPATDGPVEVSNGTWSYFVICHPEQNYLYTKIYSSLSNTDGSVLRSWVGAVPESGVIIWKEL